MARTRQHSHVVKKFRGISQNDAASSISPDYALDLLNVLPGATGLEKMRLPVALSVASGVAFGPSKFYDFQQSSNPTTKTSVRQVLAHFGTKIYTFDGDTMTNPVTIDDNIQNDLKFDWVSSNNAAYGANGRRMVKYLGDGSIRDWLPARPATAPTLNGTQAPPINTAGLTFALGGRRYRRSFKSSLDQSETSMSDASAATGNLANVSQFVDINQSDAPAGFDICVLYATLDGGGDYFYHSEGAIIAYAHYLDSKQDSQLTTTIKGSIINEPPPPGYYVAKWQGRIFVFCLRDAKTDIVYSGQEAIVVGRQETCFPPNNRLRLQIGADEIRGGGVMDQGVIAFSKSNEMYMFRGLVEDVTTSTPLNFTMILRQLPWKIGCASHYSIQSTKNGLIWLASDRSVKLFDGNSAPVTLSNRIRPLMQRISDESMPFAQSVYWEYLDREWYCLAVGLDGVVGAFTHLLIFDMTRDVERNAGIFLLQMDFESIEVVENTQGSRRLCIGHAGQIYTIQGQSDTTSGISDPITSTAGRLPAFWKSGYFGNASPQYRKMFQGAKLVTDNDGFRCHAELVDDNENTFRDPYIMPDTPTIGDSWYPIHRKAVRMAFHIQFPDKDIASNVLELTAQWRDSD